jgi:titin
VALGNSNGVEIAGGSSSNVIGGALAGARNVISGNSNYGVLVTDAGTDNNKVQGNYIGTDATGTSILGNADGVWITYANDTVIGIDGVDVGERNIISGNRVDGIRVVDVNGLTPLGVTSGTVIAGNFIGTDALGTSAVPNGWDPSNLLPGRGIRLQGPCPDTRIGTNGDGVSDGVESNVISGNSGYGLSIASGSGIIVAGNFIGGVSHGDLPLGNGQVGISVSNGYGPDENIRIGVNSADADAAAEANYIVDNSSVLLNPSLGFTPDYAAGILLNGANDTTIAGNYIGFTVTGRQLGNNRYGIYAINAENDLIGTNAAGNSTALERNVISNNSLGGIRLDHSTGITVAGNYIGTNSAGVDRECAVSLAS